MNTKLQRMAAQAVRDADPDGPGGVRMQATKLLRDRIGRGYVLKDLLAAVDWARRQPKLRHSAADLPGGSVVAAWANAEPGTGRALYGPTGEFAVIFHRADGQTILGGGYPWVTADLPSRINPDAEVQRALDGGAQVLRVGTGEAEG